MAEIQIPKRVFRDFLIDTKHTLFRPGQVSLPLGDHVLASGGKVTQDEFNEWTIRYSRQGETRGRDLVLLQPVKVVKVVQQELVDFSEAEIKRDGYQNRLDALEDLKRDDVSLNVNSAVTLIFFVLTK